MHKWDSAPHGRIGIFRYEDEKHLPWKRLLDYQVTHLRVGKIDYLS
jgi:hypothetical protein